MPIYTKTVSESCEMCGRAPAAVVTVHRVDGKVLACRRHRLTAPLCREHGEVVVRSWTRKTLVQGWWSYRSWILNIHALIANQAARRVLRMLPDPYAAPQGRSDDEPFPEHLGWGPAAFEPRPSYLGQAGVDARSMFPSHPAFGDRLGSRATDPASED
jgi:hypothetical protein